MCYWRSAQAASAPATNAVAQATTINQQTNFNMYSGMVGTVASSKMCAKAENLGKVVRRCNEDFHFHFGPHPI